jgi:hypothetical protein
MEKSTAQASTEKKPLAWYAPRFSASRKDFWGFYNLANPRVLFAIAAMAALGNVLGLLMIPVGPQTKLDLTSLPLLAIAYLFGPVPGHPSVWAPFLAHPLVRSLHLPLRDCLLPVEDAVHPHFMLLGSLAHFGLLDERGLPSLSCGDLVGHFPERDSNVFCICTDHRKSSQQPSGEKGIHGLARSFDTRKFRKALLGNRAFLNQRDIYGDLLRRRVAVQER